MSVRTTAQLAGLSPAFLSMVENGERILDRLSHIQAIATALRVSPADLIDSAWAPAVARGPWVRDQELTGECRYPPSTTLAHQVPDPEA
ncbi:hypothetical protein GCM10010452_40140 [Crossiella cryophila]|uniref:Transcriptional regulator with XRE-family HTH domain n=2 Tax=Crossiella cryophila TaxID=43355 RepID=A0A7W7CIC7_9PSEU|nr:transcriptional regulator with XRE-family HTH domain [Crossiella cryophila]